MTSGNKRRQALLAVLFASMTDAVGADHSVDHAASSAVGGRTQDALDSLGLSSAPPEAPEFLPPDVAFVLSARMRDAGTALLRWDIKEGYYLYRKRFSFESRDETIARLGAPRFPKGESRDDPYFGRQEVYYGHVEAIVPLLRTQREAAELELEVGYQGCADAGLCYPPMKKTVPLAIPAPGR